MVAALVLPPRSRTRYWSPLTRSVAVSEALSNNADNAVRGIRLYCGEKDKENLSLMILSYF
jgi:hypothetical protein